MSAQVVTGMRNRWVESKRQLRRFTLPIPEGAHVHYDANQASVIIKDRHGHCLAAVRNIEEFAVTGVEIVWSVDETIEVVTS